MFSKQEAESWDDAKCAFCREVIRGVTLPTHIEKVARKRSLNGAVPPNVFQIHTIAESESEPFVACMSGHRK